jgi:hypothetical protein
MEWVAPSRHLKCRGCHAERAALSSLFDQSRVEDVLLILFEERRCILLRHSFSFLKDALRAKVPGRLEILDLALALHKEAHGHGLYSAHAQTGYSGLPGKGGSDFVAYQPILRMESDILTL